MKTSRLENCRLIKLNEIENTQGSIVAPNFNNDIPFKPRRIFYIYDIPTGKSRGAHAHVECNQFIISAMGSFDVKLDDGKDAMKINLNRPHTGLLIPAGIWASEINFSSGGICLVITSELFYEKDYIRDYQSFKEYKYGS